MTFYGESIEAWSAAVLTGALDPRYDVYFSVTSIDDGVTVTATVGDSFILMVAYPDYLTAADVVGGLKWVLHTSGTGTLDLADASDPTWGTGATFTALPSLTVGGAMADYTFDASTSLRNAALLTSGDAIQLKVTVTSGAVTFDKVRLLIEPVGGIAGGWSPLQPGVAGTRTPDRKAVSRWALGEVVTPYGSDPQGYSDAALAIAQSGTVEFATDVYADSTVQPSSFSPSFTNSQRVSNYGTDGVGVFLDHGSAQWTMSQWAFTARLRAGWDVPNTSYTPSGVDGVDYIRRPDRTVSDATPYSAADGLSTVTSWAGAEVQLRVGGGWLIAGNDVRLGLAAWSDFALIETAPVHVDPEPWFAYGSGATAGVVTQAVGSDGAWHAIAYDPGVATEFMLILQPTLLGATSHAIDGNSDNPTFAIGTVGAGDVVNGPYANILTAPWRYWNPTLVPVTVARPLRQRQRDDGLGRGVVRARSTHSVQGSIRQRGYR